MSNRTVRDPSEHDVTLELIGVCAAWPSSASVERPPPCTSAPPRTFG